MALTWAAHLLKEKLAVLTYIVAYSYEHYKIFIKYDDTEQNSYEIIMSLTSQDLIRPRGYKTFSMLNSVEHEIFPAHKC